MVCFFSRPKKLSDGTTCWDGIEIDITDRKRAEQKLLETQVKYRAVFDNTYQLTGLLNPKGVVLEANKTALDFADLKLRDVVNKFFWQTAWWRYSKQVQKTIKDSVKQAAEGNFVRYETVIYGRNNSIRYIDFSIKPVRDKEGKIIYLIPEGRDITEKKKFREIEKSKEYSELIYKLVPSAIFTVDKDKCITSWNRKAEEITGYKADKIIGKKCTVFADKPCMEKCGLYSSDVKKPIIGRECTIKTKDNKIKFISKNTDFLKDDSGNILGGIESFEDITERKRMDAILKESEYKVRAVFDQAFQFIGLMDLNGVLVDANRAALDFAGIDQSKVLKKPFWETPWWTHSVEMQNKLKDAFCKAKKGEFVRFEATHLAKDGSLHYIDFSLKPIKDEHGNVIYFIPEGRDITEQKKLQEKVLQSEKLSALGKLAGSISHELRNPLAVIKNAVYFLEKYGANIGDEKTKEYMEIMKRHIDMSNKIIGGVLDFSKTKELDKKYYKICDAIDYALHEIDIPSCIHIYKKYKDNPEVFYDMDLIMGSFRNILENSVHAIKGAGKIEIITKIEDGFLKIVFKDNGCGIEKADIGRLFEPLFSKKIRGVGFGLPIVKSNIERHGWEIFIESQIGVGTSVVIKIPA